MPTITLTEDTTKSLQAAAATRGVDTNTLAEEMILKSLSDQASSLHMEFELWDRASDAAWDKILVLETSEGVSPESLA